MRLSYVNIIDASGVIFTPSTYDQAYPASNVANEHRTLGWKTGTTQAAETLVIDLGSAQAATSIILLDHDLTAGDSLIKIQANATDAWGAPTLNQALTWAAGTIAQNFSIQTLRYWRLIFTKSAAGEARTIGRIFIGQYYTATELPMDVKIKPVDLSQSQMTEGGQDYSDAQDQYRGFELPFRAVSQTQRDALESFAEYVGTHTAFFFQIDENSSYPKFSERVYAKLTKLPEWNPNGFFSDGNLAWDTTLEAREQL